MYLQEIVISPEWHKEILDERLKKIENGEMKFVSWEMVKEMLQEK